MNYQTDMFPISSLSLRFLKKIPTGTLITVANLPAEYDRTWEVFGHSAGLALGEKGGPYFLNADRDKAFENPSAGANISSTPATCRKPSWAIGRDGHWEFFGILIPKSEVDYFARHPHGVIIWKDDHLRILVVHDTSSC